LLAHFQFNKPLNFPFYFLKILEKMSSQLRKNVTNPHNNLFHHGLIKLLVLDEVEKQGQTWDEFIYQFAKPHLTIKTGKKTLGLRTISPSKPHSPRTPNPPAQTISLPEKKSKKLVETPASSLGKKTKSKDQRKIIANLQMPSISLDPTPKNLQEVIQQDFPTFPTNRRGYNRFDRGPFQKSTRSTRGKPYAKSLTTLNPIQVSSDLESPHKRLREVYADELKSQRKKNPNLLLLINTLLLLTHRCLPQILRMIVFLHLSRDLSLPPRYLILIRPWRNYNKRIFICCNNWKIGRLWTHIFTMIMQSSKQR
jgi:hypothetical protein